jgi:hypothetical protein
MKYKTKLAASQRRIDSAGNPPKSNRTLESRSKSMGVRNRSIEASEPLYEDIYKDRPKSLRRATSIRAERRQNTAANLRSKQSANLFASFKES